MSGQPKSQFPNPGSASRFPPPPVLFSLFLLVVDLFLNVLGPEWDRLGQHLCIGHPEAAVRSCSSNSG